MGGERAAPAAATVVAGSPGGEDEALEALSLEEVEEPRYVLTEGGERRDEGEQAGEVSLSRAAVDPAVYSAWRPAEGETGCVRASIREALADPNGESAVTEDEDPPEGGDPSLGWTGEAEADREEEREVRV